MRCPNCNSRIENEANICRYCGHDFTGKKNPTLDEQYNYSLNYSKTKDEEVSHDEQKKYSYNYSKADESSVNISHSEQKEYSYNYSDANEDDVNTDHGDQYSYSSEYSRRDINDSSMEVYRDAYISFNRNIIDSDFNICAFIFGPFYCLYRKLTGLGVIVLVFYLLFMTMPVLYIFINIVLAVEFKKYYYQDMDKKINKILEKNQNKSKEELIELVKKEGSVSLRGIAVAFIIMIILIAVASFIFEEIVVTNKNKKEYPLSALDYKLPNDFSLLSSDTNYIAFDNINDIHNCVLNISKQDYKYFKNEIGYIKTTDNIKDDQINLKKINSSDWYYYTIDNKDYYVTKKDNYFYKVVFSTYKDKDGYCDNIRNSIINSLKFEEE